MLTPVVEVGLKKLVLVAHLGTTDRTGPKRAMGCTGVAYPVLRKWTVDSALSLRTLGVVVLWARSCYGGSTSQLSPQVRRGGGGVQSSPALGPLHHPCHATPSLCAVGVGSGVPGACSLRRVSLPSPRAPEPSIDKSRCCSIRDFDTTMNIFFYQRTCYMRFLFTETTKTPVA